jgi:uncharacterized membrane protein YeaQ/YmgE (transglycosylase-associated protein family)
MLGSPVNARVKRCNRPFAHPQKGFPVLQLLSSLPSSFLAADTVVVSNNDDRGMLMSIIVWLVVGLIAGFLASKVVNKRGEGVVLDIILGLVGAFVGGFIIHLLGFHRNGSIVWSIVVATLGAILVLVIYHKLIRRDHAVR